MCKGEAKGEGGGESHHFLAKISYFMAAGGPPGSFVVLGFGEWSKMVTPFLPMLVVWEKLLTFSKISVEKSEIISEII